MIREESWLEEAKRKYPIGTRVKGLHIGRIFEVDLSLLSMRHDNHIMHDDNGKYSDSYDCIRDCSHRWAEIVSKYDLLEEARKKYPKGTLIKSASTDNNIISDGEPIWYEKDVSIHITGQSGLVYYNRKWGEIVEPPKVLIFNNIYAGDIVVSLKTILNSRENGEMLIAELGSHPGILRYRHNSKSSSQKGEWRKATLEEIEAYNKGVKNIKDIAKTPAFIVGNWYKLETGENNNSTKVHYVNYIKYKSNIGRTLYCDEFINILPNGNGYKTNINCTFASMLLVNPIDNSEVSIFLPKNHLDKIIEPEVGRWYKYNDWYIKFYRNNNNVFQSSEEIRPNRTYYKAVSNFGKPDSSKVLLEDLTEIQEYLPDGHVDKIKPVMKSLYWIVNNQFLNKFKVPIEGKVTGDLEGFINLINNRFYMGGGGSLKGNSTIPTDDEIKWLEECISANKFISKEEVLKMKYPLTKKDCYQSELTSLPEKWCIKITRENVVVLARWRTNGYEGAVNESNPSGYLYNEGYRGVRGYYESIVIFGYTEITYDMFKQHILGIQESTMSERFSYNVKLPDLISSKKGGQLDTKVNLVYSINIDLKEKQKVTYF